MGAAVGLREVSVRRALRMVCALLVGCACGDEEICRVEGGAYYAMLPADWDGRSPLPVVLTAHGYNGSAESLRSRSWLGTAWREAGALWVVPEGEGGSWATTRSPETRDPAHRDDVAWLGAVLDDVATRWPIDRARVASSGFSQGASMASELSCRDPERWPVTMPVSGTFWKEEPDRCEAPVAVRHTHGMGDSTWPLDGRPIAEWHQGAVWEAMTTWTTTAGCDEAPDTVREAGRTCTVYRGCAGGDIRLCFHDGAHVYPADEARLQVEWLGMLGWW